MLAKLLLKLVGQARWSRCRGADIHVVRSFGICRRPLLKGAALARKEIAAAVAVKMRQTQTTPLPAPVVSLFCLAECAAAGGDSNATLAAAVKVNPVFILIESLLNRGQDGTFVSPKGCVVPAMVIPTH